ncbi:MAG TPA: MBL fold metallo-hydrolase [Microbacterium sp.]|nr:MBL fold metallo-hydrolase [Microbacterium sp.]
MHGRLTFVGHSTVLIEMGGERLLTDPLLVDGVGHIRRQVPAPDVEALATLSAILISHAHADHLHPPSLRRLGATCPVIVPSGCARLIRRAASGTVVELDAGERHSIGPVGIEAVAAHHDGRRHPLGRPLPALGFLLEGPARIYFAGDTDLFDGMAELAGRVDVALLPVGGWGPRLPPGHMDPDSAARATALIRPAVAVPIHWGTMRSIGAPRAVSSRLPAVAFADAVARMGIGTDVRILLPGEALDLDVLAPGPAR